MEPQCKWGKMYLRWRETFIAHCFNPGVNISRILDSIVFRGIYQSLMYIGPYIIVIVEE